MVDSSSVSFQIKNAGIIVNGTFERLDALIQFDTDHLDTSRIIASVDAGSINTGIRIRDKHLRKAEFFHVDTYPLIQLFSRSFIKLDDTRFLGHFTLQIKGRTELISVPFSLQKESNSFVFEGDFEIDRVEYGIGGPGLLLDDLVKIHIWVKGKESR